jgi:hypothetical protein
MIDQQLIEFMPHPLPRDDGTTFREWVVAHQNTLDEFGADLEAILASHQITTAAGEHLDRIGAMFGALGKRRGRPDQAYRQFLLSLVQSFKGRGTVPGIRFAVAAGVLAHPDTVTVTEDFDALEYELTLTEWAPHATSTIAALASLSDASVSERRAPLHYLLAGDAERPTSDGARVVSSTSGLGSGTLGDGTLS